MKLEKRISLKASLNRGLRSDSKDARLLEPSFCHNVKDRYGEPERGSEWEPIKILLEGDENSYKMNTASNTRLRLTTQVGQAHVATGVPLNLGTNTHNLATRECSGTPNLESTDQHRSDR
jgi:hypothetical protein